MTETEETARQFEAAAVPPTQAQQIEREHAKRMRMQRWEGRAVVFGLISMALAGAIIVLLIVPDAAPAPAVVVFKPDVVNNFWNNTTVVNPPNHNCDGSNETGDGWAYGLVGKGCKPKSH